MANKITWYAKLTNSTLEYTPTSSFYAGSYDQDNQINVTVQIWNNRYGTTAVDDLTDFDLAFYFDNIEDMSLYDYCVVLYNGTALAFHTVGTRGILEFPTSVTISGGVNDGTEENNTANYLQLQFIFNAYDARLKTNDLKSLYFEILPR